ncbi:MAG: hypothetical protein SFX74_07535 [Fimbriimonadaceae bacterium]|nr:hypothetical protein [Fimbriimonadaceae bacterium]
MTRPRLTRSGFGFIATLALIVMIAIIAIGGCNRRETDKPNPPRADAPRPSEPVPLPEVIRTGAGESDLYTETAPRRKRWTVRWKSSEIRPEQREGGASPMGRGDFRTVTGSLYDGADDTRVSSRFEAERAQVDQTRRTLKLTGRVRLVSEPPADARSRRPVVLTCDTMTYSDRDRIIRASGNVKIEMAQGELGFSNDLWANPELTRIGSPDLFRAARP